MPSPAPLLRLALTGLLITLAAAAPVHAATRTPARAAPLPMRLPEGVRPTAYRLSLVVDPAQPTHRGEVEIDITLSKPSGTVLLHAKDLRITAAWAETGAHRRAAQVRQRDPERIELRLPRPLPAGKAVLGLSFEGRLQDKDVYGLFRQRDREDAAAAAPGGGWAAFTQFEATGARLAFPLFDEPGFKLPWSLSLTVPEGLTAVANMPVTSESPAAGGRKRVQFATTPPLPAYLLAFAVGDFGVREAPASSPAGTPIRFVVPRGREAEAEFAAGITGRVLEQLERYFDMPYPYAKLDSLAIPVTVGFSAMEHPGLVTYASTLMLAPPGQASASFRQEYTSTAAHELAHQWFGNLVTMAWWDDLWLNESFASWLGDRITAQVLPDAGWDAAPAHARRWAMRADRLASARRIEQPVRVDEDMGNLWDAITYQKGQAVLGMAEGWLGEARFREGVQRYMQRHAWGHATSADFFAALGTGASGTGTPQPTPDDAALPAAIRSFTTQAGIPLLHATLQCTAGQPPQLLLAQSRLLPLGSPAVAGPPTRWQVPVRVRTPAGLTRLMLDAPQATLTLPDADCPAWLNANADGSGYYRVAYAADGLARLTSASTLASLTIGEALTLIDDAAGLHDAGQIDTAAALAVVQAFAGHPRRAVVEAAAELLAHLKPLAEAGAARTAYAARWQAAFGERARALGWRARPGDGDDANLLRAELLPRLAELGDDAVLRAEARALTLAWLADAEAHALSSDLRRATLSAAALDGDAALFDALLATLRRSSDRTLRSDLLSALGHFRQPALAQRARSLLLDSGIDIRESLWPLMGGQTADATTRRAALADVAGQFEALARRMGRDDPAGLPRLFRNACGADERRQLEAAFGRAMPRYLGGQRALQRTLESVDLCSAWRARQSASF
ncbi:M1 family metallopeptidase [Aquabacterium sp. OR-4]|uniref:M1 family metallopeptidase n=1 Tax=Aquabacterium sp. OR-4 TaxID=2978127 RepID=UPI0021B4BFF8|nr:M1 family metallopeptidase [Aquabacterium sp. OR-4]MDT7834883.1 M1 family metallopeptidase [Aquabacterium sp. OR-4]